MGRKTQKGRHSQYSEPATRNFIFKGKHSLPYNINRLQELRVEQHGDRNGLPEVITRDDFHMLETLVVQHSS